MRYKFLSILLFSVVLLFSCKQEEVKEKVKIDYDKLSWPIFRGNSNLSGVSDSELADKLKLNWSFETGADIIASPVLGNGKVFIGSTNGSLYALNLKDGSQAWKFDTGDDIEASALLIDSTLYVGNLSGDFFSINANTGSLNWKTNVQSDIRGSANFVNVPDKESKLIFVGCYDSKMYCFDSETGKPVWEYKTGNYINGAPATDGNLIVFGGCDAKLHIVNIFDGSKIGEVKTGSYIPGSSAFVNGKAYLGKYDRKLLKIDIEKEKILWQFEDKENGGPFFSTPAIGENVIIVGSRNSYLYCLDKETGEEKWSFKTLDEIDSSPVIVKDKVIFGSTDGRVYMLDISSGKQIWSYEIGASITSSAAVAGGLVIIGAEDGRIYTFGEAL